MSKMVPGRIFFESSTIPKKKNTLFLLLLIYVAELISAEDECPDKCNCTFVRGKGTRSSNNDFLKVKCGESSKISSIDSINFDYVSSNIVHLDLSQNDVSILRTSFLKLPNLEKLDLSNNNISIIEPKAFHDLTYLRRLDLSHNKIKFIKRFMFEDLKLLERLKINQNLITVIYEHSFDSLTTLKQLDVSENQLHCDCKLLWFAEWCRNTSVKLLSTQLKCETPQSLKSQAVKKFKPHCDHISEYDTGEILELKPLHNQVVFQGDSLVLKCSSFNIESGDENAKIVWLWEDKNPATHFDEIKVENRFHGRSGFVESSLNISHILKGHSGVWNCCLLTNQGNHSRTISVIVISEDTLYCNQTETSNNKGVYFWPKTIAGFTVELSCVEQVINSTQRAHFRAYHTCTEAGGWDNLNTAHCPYVSGTTKILEQFSKMNLSIAKKSVLESAKRLRNFTGDGRILTDSMDVVFISKTIENYLEFVATEKELGAVLIDILASVLHLPRHLLQTAQNDHLACSRMVSCVEVVAKQTPVLQLHKSNLAVEAFKIKSENFSGITCTWYSSTASKTINRFFHCSTSNKTSSFVSSDRTIEASIQIPASLFHQLNQQGKLPDVDHQLLVSMYENNNFFPRIVMDNSPDVKKDITSCVVGSKLVGMNVANLSDPVYVSLKAPLFLHTSSPRPVWYDVAINNGTGGWSQEGCSFSHFFQGLIVFTCDRLGYFGLLQDTHYLHDYSGRYNGAKFRLCHPAVYIGSFILITCLLVAIVTYITSHDCIQMSRRTKHSLVNTWISMSFLCFIFSFGVFQTEAMRTCQGVGLVLHYFSLSTLLWMSVTANSMYKRWSKTDPLNHVADDDLPTDEPIQKPILGLYLVGWGIGLIICGISGAVNLKEYAGHSFCFFSSGPALSAVFVPATLLFLFLLICYLLTFCAIRNNDMNGQLSEGTQGTENVDLELLEVPLNTCTERRSIQSIMTPTDSDDIDDPEHAPVVQLKAQIIVFIFYVIGWVSAAVSVSQVFTPHIPYEEDIFSTLYCFVSIFFGTFILYFYCVARSDVRGQWCLLKKLFNGHSRCCRSRNISDTLTSIPVTTTTVPVRNGNHLTVPTLSSSSVNSSGFTNKSNGQSVRASAVKKLNRPDGVGEPVVMHSKTTNSVNLVVMHRQMYRSNNSMPTYHEISGPDVAEAFYNPHQSIVARKFFKKQKRNKRNDLGLRRRGDGGGGTSDGGVSQDPRPWRPSAESAVFLSSDMENASEKLGPTFFNHGSKVNNTNLHVKSSKSKRGRSSRDPNIMTNSEGEEDTKKIHLPIDRLVIGAEETNDKVVTKTDSPGSLTPDCNLSRVDEVSAGEDVNSTAVNTSEISACRDRLDDVGRCKDNDTTDDDYSNEVCEDTTLCPDYRTVELQCSLGEHSCSDLNSEINYCDSTNNDYACCMEPDTCPSDCCSKNGKYIAPGLSQSSSCSYEDPKNLRNVNNEESDDEHTVNQEEQGYDSFCRKVDDLHFLSNSEANAKQESPPKYVTVLDPQFGLVKVTLNEYNESSHRLSLAEETKEDVSEVKTETTV